MTKTLTVEEKLKIAEDQLLFQTGGDRSELEDMYAVGKPILNKRMGELVQKRFQALSRAEQAEAALAAVLEAWKACEKDDPGDGLIVLASDEILDLLDSIESGVVLRSMTDPPATAREHDRVEALLTQLDEMIEARQKMLSVIANDCSFDHYNMENATIGGMKLARDLFNKERAR